MVAGYYTTAVVGVFFLNHKKVHRFLQTADMTKKTSRKGSLLFLAWSTLETRIRS